VRQRRERLRRTRKSACGLPKPHAHLTSQANIRGFIACIGHGMLIEIIRKDDGAKLLYAAQTALAALPRELKSAGRPQSNRVYQKINIPPPFPPYVND
jgi:hypothetical protein